MLIEELIPNVNLESKVVEFKGIIQEGENPKDPKHRLEYGWLKEIVGFANSYGGSLYVGVDNKTHKLMALDHVTVDKIILMVHRLVKAHIEPPIVYDFINHPVPDTKPIRYILEIRVEPTKYPPITLKFDGDGSVFVRHFGETSVATGEEIRDMVACSEFVSFDDRFSQEEYHEEDFSKLFAYYAKRHPGGKPTLKELISIGFVSTDNRLSQGALLFKDDYSHPRTLVVCSQFLGVSKGDNTFYASKSMQGNLLDEYAFMKDFVQSRSADGFVKKGDGRVPLVSYPENALREALINALGHRNYFMMGRQIEVNLYKDRLEIVSPGSLVGSKDLKEERNLASIDPARRNEVICDIFTMLELMEKRGSGFDKIEKAYDGYEDNYLPFASSNSQSFTLVLPDLAHDGGMVSGIDCPTVHTSIHLDGKYDLAILSYCYNQKRDAGEIAKHLGVTSSTYFRTSVLEPLVKKGYLRLVKMGRTSFYNSDSEKVLVD